MNNGSEGFMKQLFLKTVVESERTRLPLRGAVRGLWILAGETPANSGRREICGDFRLTEAK